MQPCEKKVYDWGVVLRENGFTLHFKFDLSASRLLLKM